MTSRDRKQGFATVRITPDTVALVVGDTIQLHAVALDAGGAPVEGVRFEWRSSDATAARVDADGRVTAGPDARVATITARAGTASGSALLAGVLLNGLRVDAPRPQYLLPGETLSVTPLLQPTP